jgi:hypothetical protein
MPFEMDWSQLTGEQVQEEHARDVRYFAGAVTIGNGAEDYHARNAHESAGELRHRGIDPFDEEGPA